MYILNNIDLSLVKSIKNNWTPESITKYNSWIYQWDLKQLRVAGNLIEWVVQRIKVWIKLYFSILNNKKLALGLGNPIQTNNLISEISSGYCWMDNIKGKKLIW